VIPDWSAATSPSARAALEGMFEAFIGPKWLDLDAIEDQVRRVVLRAYAAAGQAPEAAQVAVAAGLVVEDAVSALRRLAARDLVVLDIAGRVTGAYPFTDASTEHRVEVAGVAVSAMCAIDALGIGAMLSKDAIIHSACRRCQHALRIHIRNCSLELDRVEPTGVVVWSGHRYAGDCAASSLCTAQAFFCDDDHLVAWRASGPAGAEDGVRLSLPEALDVGRAIFAPMRMELQPWTPTT
jgi:alkylmercury lyase